MVMTNGRAEYTDLEADCGGRAAVLFTGGRTLDVLRPTVRVKADGGTAANLLTTISDANPRRLTQPATSEGRTPSPEVTSMCGLPMRWFARRDATLLYPHPLRSNLPEGARDVSTPIKPLDIGIAWG